MNEAFELLREAPCTCLEPNGVGVVDHDECNQKCFKTKADVLLSKIVSPYTHIDWSDLSCGRKS